MTEIQWLPIREVHPYEKNPRFNDDSVEAVANSIRAFGFRAPIILDKDHVIIAGHTRLKAAKKLRLKEVPCIIADDLTPEQVEAYRIADNSAGSKSDWDYELLQDIMGSLKEYDFADFGLELPELYVEGPEVLDDITDDEPPAPPKTSDILRGQIFRLGDHVLMCGDSTDPADVQKLINALDGGGPMDLLMTDPPYNVAIVGETKEHLTIENDDMDADVFREFLVKAFSNAEEHMKEGAPFYIWHASRTSREFMDACEEAGLTVKQTLIWVKNIFVLGRQDYQWRHEPCLYGWKEGQAHYFIADRTLDTVTEKPMDIEGMSEKDLRETLRRILAETPSDVIHANKPARNAEHPTMKPVTLMARMIYNSSKPRDKVLDLFGGSGSTLMACEQLHRRCAIMEYDPVYCDVIIKRWQDSTGRTAERIA